MVNVNKYVSNELRFRMRMSNDKNAKMRILKHDAMMRKKIGKKNMNRVMRITDSAIIMHDAKYNDIIGASIFASVFIKIIIPLLLSMLKSAAIGAMSSSIKQHVVDPIVKRLINRGQKLVLNKDKNETFTSAIIKGIKQDMNELAKTLRGEKDFIAQKLFASYNKIKSIS